MRNNQLAIIFLTAICIIGICAFAKNEDPKKPLLLANYYVWYHDGAHSSSPWAGWSWASARTNALALAAQKKGEPPLASVDYPLTGLYDSADPEVAELHVKLAQAAGLDAFLIGWWGSHLGRDQNLESGIAAAAEKHNFKVALLDERAQFHHDFEWYKKSLTTALMRFKDRSCYLHIEGKPVIYLYQVAANPTLTPAKFAELKKDVESQTGPVYWIVDKIAHDLKAGRAGDEDKVKHIPAEWLKADGIDCFAFYSTFSNFRAHRYEELAGKFKYLTKLAHDAGKKCSCPCIPDMTTPISRVIRISCRGGMVKRLEIIYERLRMRKPILL